MTNSDHFYSSSSLTYCVERIQLATTKVLIVLLLVLCSSSSSFWHTTFFAPSLSPRTSRSATAEVLIECSIVSNFSALVQHSVVKSP